MRSEEAERRDGGAAGEALASEGTGPFEVVLEEHRKVIDGFPVGRLLPVMARRAVGPFVFFDHMGPTAFEPGRGLDVRPHPHIHLSTVTWLFEGEILHRDSLGYVQVIAPGAVNWMTAGRGIVHSERTPPEARERGGRIHGLQLWVASPVDGEDVEPAFSHHPAETLPVIERAGVKVVVLAGEAYGVRSPVPVQSPLCYVEARLSAGASLEAPDQIERAIYVVSGELEVDGEGLGPERLGVLRAGARTIVARTEVHFVVIGGAPLGARTIWWNFVSSREEAVAEAARRWQAGGFPRVPGETEFIPLETLPPFARAT
jgi:hypothetical protein